MGFGDWVTRILSGGLGRSKGRRTPRRKLDALKARVALLEGALDAMERSRDEWKAEADVGRRRIEEIEETEHELTVQVRNLDGLNDNLKTQIDGQSKTIVCQQADIDAMTARAMASIAAAQAGRGGQSDAQRMFGRD